jgi:sterol desaturase/sphingolipid hydroxylase (fatty acid hydroxylase superfamily)
MWKPIEAIFNTPSHHRVHHATNPRYLDANYAGTLIIWDRMFGYLCRGAGRGHAALRHRQEHRHLQSDQGRVSRMDRPCSGTRFSPG